MKTTAHRLSADPHLLSLLGDELIGNDRLAVFELVKNAYDADATQVTVDLRLTGPKPTLQIRDNGSGMTRDTLIGSWMRLATGQKRGKTREPSKEFHRLPLGEKGVGRLAVQKLGGNLKLVTRAMGDHEYVVEINWMEFLRSAEDLTGLEFNLQELDHPDIFQGKAHGTLIEISNLNRKEWERRDLRDLKKLLESLKSPFENVSDFNVELNVPGRDDEIQDLLKASDILDRAVWIYSFKLDEHGNFDWSYEFRPPAAFEKRLRGRELKPADKEDYHLQGMKLAAVDKIIRHSDDRDTLHVVERDMMGMGPIAGRFYVFDRRRDALEPGTFQQMRQYLDEQTGVRVYRDGVRVFNYGEPNDDWLLLNAKRINRPAERMGTNSVIGAVHISQSSSTQLKEKTNREGFDESTVFLRFRWIVQSIVNHLDKLRRPDRENLDKVIEGTSLEKQAPGKKPFEAVVEELRGAIKKRRLESELGKQVDYIEREFLQMRDVLSESGIAGLNLALVFHEIEREVISLRKAIEESESYPRLRERAGHVVGLLDAISGLLRKSQRRSGSIKELLKRIFALNEARFKHHRITFSCPVLTGEDKDFEIKGPLNLYLAAINNLVNNAIHWSRVRAELEPKGGKPAIAIRTFPNWYKDGHALVVADNGSGFRISPEDAIRPFVTTRPGGMGLGLYYANLVMESTGGELLITDLEEFDLSRSFSGAVVALRFKKG
jgi:signal transduction histidine kinase